MTEANKNGKGINQEQLRAAIDTTCDAIFERAQEMIKQGVTVKMAYRLAISWELEINAYKSYAELTRQMAEMDRNVEQSIQRDLDTFKRVFGKHGDKSN